jgi:hypothetical protein
MTRLDYEALIVAYRESLVTRLRGFRAGDAASFLESWVCHDDDVRSVEELLDAAADHGLRSVALRFAKPTLERVRLDALTDAMAAFGELEVTPELDGSAEVIVTLRAGGRGDARPKPASVARRAAPSPVNDHETEIGTNAIYDAALARIEAFPHEAPPTADAISVVFGGGCLSTVVDPRTGCVASATHGGGVGPMRALLELTCTTIETLPLREVSDHGALRVELALRGRRESRPVAGVTTVASADRRLRECERALRELVTLWEQREGALPIESEFVRPPRASWTAASAKERIARIDAVLAEVLPTLGLAATSMRCLDVEHDVRVILTGRPLASGAPLFDIEHVLKERVEPELAVYLDEMVDANVIRRLTRREAP